MGDRLGILAGPAPASLAAELDPKTHKSRGVYVAEVENNSLAASMGLKVGDLILKLNGRWLDKTADLKQAFALGASEAPLTLSVLRAGRMEDLLGKFPKREKKAGEVEETKPLKERKLRKF